MGEIITAGIEVYLRLQFAKRSQLAISVVGLLKWEFFTVELQVSRVVRLGPTAGLSDERTVQSGGLIFARRPVTLRLALRYFRQRCSARFSGGNDDVPAAIPREMGSGLFDSICFWLRCE